MTRRGGKVGQVALGFSVHTGWAALVAVTGTARDPVIVERARVEMIGGEERDPPRFVYHASQELSLGAAARFVERAAAMSRRNATAAVRAVVTRLPGVAGAGVIVANRPLEASLEQILASHSLVHAAEGELFREAIKSACEGLDIPVVGIPAGELAQRGAEVFGIAPGDVPDRLAELGRAAGRPWAKDQKDALLAALVSRAG